VPSKSISLSVFHWQTNILPYFNVIETVHSARSQYTVAMIAGAHFLLYSRDPEADRAFLKTILEFPAVDLGEGWLLFGLPPAELAIHPGDGEFVQWHAEHPMLGAVLYQMCYDLASVIWVAQKQRCTRREPSRSRMGTQHQYLAPERRDDRPLLTDSSHDD
jgi:hypothetical protein